MFERLKSWFVEPKGISSEVELIDAAIGHISEFGFEGARYHCPDSGGPCCFIGTLNFVQDAAVQASDRYTLPLTASVLSQLDRIALDRRPDMSKDLAVLYKNGHLGRVTESMAYDLKPQGAIEMLREARASFTMFDELMMTSPPAPEPEPIDRETVWS